LLLIRVVAFLVYVLIYVHLLFFYSTEDEYASHLSHIFHSSFTGSEEMQLMRQRARSHVTSFSDEVFLSRVQTLWNKFIKANKH
jgi:hypothetical protein